MPLKHIMTPADSSPEPEMICDDCNNEIEYEAIRVS